MLRRPFCGMAVCFLFGILSAAYLGETKPVWFIPVTALVWIALLCLTRYFTGEARLLRVRITLCILMVCIGFGQYVSEQTKRERYLTALTDGMLLTVQGDVAGKQLRNNQYIYELTSCLIGPYQYDLSAQEPIVCNRILAYSDSDVASIGETLVLNGTVELWEHAVNEGNFDANSFYLACKIDFRLNDITILTAHGKASLWKEKLFFLRLQLKEVYQTVMTQEASGVMATMVLGDKTLLSAETKRLYQIAGLSHIMAISGLHISVIGMSLYGFLRKRGLGFWVSGSIAGALLYAYGTMVGMGTSVQRSVGMFVMLLFAQALGRGYDSLNALGVMALVLLWKNPYLPWDAGFQFSFVAILGVVWLGRCVSFEDMPHAKRREKIFVSATVLLATLPLVAWHYYEVPMYAMFVNLLVLPLMGVLLSLGVTGGLVGLLSLRGAAGILFFCEKLLALVGGLCGLCAKLPQSMVIVGRPKLWQVVCYYTGLVLLALWAYHRKAKPTDAEKHSGNKRLRGAAESCKERGETIRRRYSEWALWGITVSMLLIILTLPASRGLELDILDVGQGDGAFLRTRDGYTVFIDGGSTNIKQVGTYRMLPFLKYKGARRIDFWLVSHTDEDHISGLRELLEAGYEVSYLVFAEGIMQDEKYEELQNLAKENGTEILYVTAEDILHLGAAKLYVLYPKAGNEIAAADKNASSLVVLYEEDDFTAIFTGDIGSEQEDDILLAMENLAAQGSIPDCEIDVYKAAHHGSKYSNSAELLNALRPEIATVSCAKRNSYGHPGEEAIAHMQEAGSRVFYTMESGQITVRIEGEEVKVYEFRGEQGEN